jgi:hypothetical protein
VQKESRCYALFIGVGKQDEPKIFFDNVFENQIKEFARLNRNAQSPSRQALESVKSVGIFQRLAPLYSYPLFLRSTDILPLGPV